jgi:hypothetical protein
VPRMLSLDLAEGRQALDLSWGILLQLLRHRQ